jgi:hypothetical protein
MTRRRPVDLVAVRAARAQLDALARDHPELRGPRGTGNIDDWTTSLERDEQMADTEQVAFRLPKSLIAKLDDYAAQLAKEQPGMSFTRTDVVRVLLTRALDAAPTKPQRSRSR